MSIACCFPRPQRLGGDDIQSRLEGLGQLFQRAALYFASQPFREVCQEDDLFWSLVFCDSSADKISKFLLTTDDPVAQSHESNYLFSVDRVRHADDSSLKNCGMHIQNLFHFLRRDVGATPNDDLLQATFEPKETVSVAPDQVACPQPAVGKCRSCGCCVVPIPDE